MAIREGKWRCTYCSNVNRGALLACAGCGAQRDKDVVFFLEDEAPEVTDESLLAVARAGADWLCQFCQTSNRPELTHCVQCGAEKGTSPSRPVHALLDGTALAAPAASPASVATQVPRSRGCRTAIVALLLAAMACCAALAYFALRKTNETLTVAGFEWQCSIAVEALRTVRESAWEDALPRGARVVSKARAVHHTDQVQTGTQRVKVGQRDLGNGFFEDVYEDRPTYSGHDVYAVKVTYDVERWQPARNVEAKGGDRRPRWPDVSFASNERELRRTATYVVQLTGAKRSYRMELPLERWAVLEEGLRYEAVIQGGSKVLELK